MQFIVDYFNADFTYEIFVTYASKYSYFQNPTNVDKSLMWLVLPLFLTD
jgi:hypothetical protein